MVVYVLGGRETYEQKRKDKQSAVARVFVKEVLHHAIAFHECAQHFEMLPRETYGVYIHALFTPNS